MSCALVILEKYACVKALSHWRSCALWVVGVQVAFSGVFVLIDPLGDPTLTGCRLHGDGTGTARPCLGFDTAHRSTRADGLRVVIVVVESKSSEDPAPRAN